MDGSKIEYLMDGSKIGYLMDGSKIGYLTDGSKIASELKEYDITKRNKGLGDNYASIYNWKGTILGSLTLFSHR